MRSCSRKKYRPTIVPVKCPRNPLATGFPLAAFRSLLRREPRDFSSSGGTGVINDLRIENPWNENREHHARIRGATCACDRLRIEKGRRGERSLRAHELLPIPRSIHRGQKTRFLRETIIVLSTFRIPLDNVSASSLTGLIDDRAPRPGQLLLLLSIESLMPRILTRSTFCFHRLRTSYFDSIYLYFVFTFIGWSRIMQLIFRFDRKIVYYGRRFTSID